jgi:hypothetical protein
MRFLDLDLDFFLNKNAYSSGHESVRLGPDYKPWTVSRVRRFLEGRCGLSPDAPVLGRTVNSHDGVLNFWRALINSGKLRIPFEVVHIDAHPDVSVGNGFYLTSHCLYVEPGRGLAVLKAKNIHSGNYLTFALVYGWIDALVWVPLGAHLESLPEWDADARLISTRLKNGEGHGSSDRDLPATAKEAGISFKMLPRRKFKTSETFDYIALSKSPDCTPPESDGLVPVIEEYIKQI